MKKILITGAAGFIGSHLHNVLKNDSTVTGIDLLDPSNTAALKRNTFFGSASQASVHSDFLSQQEEQPDLLIHLAAETGISGSLHNPSLYFVQNVEGTFNVLEECRKNGVRHFIYASSSSVYEPASIMNEDSPHNHQLSFYGTSKRITELMIENYCRQFGITAIGLRFFTVYGSWTRPDMAAYKFMQAISNGEAITLHNSGNVFRDFTHVSDIVESIRLLTDKIADEPPGSHQVFNIGYGSPVSVRQYAEHIAHCLGKELKTTDSVLPSNELESTHSDTSRLEQYIGYKPVCSVEEGIREMTDWFKSYRYE